MKKKIFLALAISLLLVCLFAISVSAEVTTYDDAPARTKIVVSTNDVVVFDDGFTCPTGYVFKDQTEISNGGHNNPSISWAFDFSYINEKTQKEYTFANVVELDIPQGVTYVGQYAAMGIATLKRVTFPDSITSLGQCIFQGTTSLEKCEFEHSESSNFTTFPNYMFYNTALTAFSMPDCITTVAGSAQFASCENLTAVYISKNITSWSSGNQTNASFYNDTGAYFVNEPFTYDNIPTKPEIYYFPKNLASISGETFKTCTNLNEVLVFGEALTELNYTNAPWIFNGCGNTSTIVFLGDMTTVMAGDSSSNFYWSVKNIYFANANDKTFTDAGFVGNQSNGKVVFCNAEGNTNHLYLEKLNREATCTVDGIVGLACFCGNGDPINSETVYAKGHEKTEIISIVYNGTNKFFEKGDVTYTCGVCTEEHTVTGDAAEIFASLGLSTKQVGGNAIMQSFMVDREAMELYNEKSDYDVVGYGLVAGTTLALGTDAEIFDAKGEVTATKAGVVNISARNEKYDIFEMKVAGLSGTVEVQGEQVDLSTIDVYCCGYCLVQIGDNVASYYASEGIVTETLSGATSYEALSTTVQG